MSGIDTDDLYGLPLERFVPERVALARAMRAEGRRDDAAAVAQLPKPSVAAWVVNQLVRGNRHAMKSLLDAGDALRAAQTAVIEGRGDGHTLRAAVERERAAVDDLLGAVGALAGEGGLSLSHTIIDRVADTLHAAAFDEQARERIRDGRLERELRHVGLGALAAGPLTPPEPQPRSKRDTDAGKAAKPDAAAASNAAKPDAAAAGKAGNAGKAGKAGKARKADKQAEAEARGAAKQAEAEARRAAKQAEAVAREALHEAKQAEAQARRRSERAARALTRAEERQVQAVQTLREADDALAAARTESEAADEALAAARSQAQSAAKAQRQAATG